jgi:hypothetical protein
MGTDQAPTNLVSRNDKAVTPSAATPASEGGSEILKRIESAFAWIDRLASQATSARKLIDRLDQGSQPASSWSASISPSFPASGDARGQNWGQAFAARLSAVTSSFYGMPTRTLHAAICTSCMFCTVHATWMPISVSFRMMKERSG